VGGDRQAILDCRLTPNITTGACTHSPFFFLRFIAQRHFFAPTEFFPLDHDQRNTLSWGGDINPCGSPKCDPQSWSIFLVQAGTLSLHLTNSSFGLRAHAPLTNHRDSQAAHTPTGRYIERWAKGLGTRPPDHNDGATRPGDHAKARIAWLRNEFCTPEFPSPVQGACGPRDDRRRTRKADASDAVRWEQLRGRVARGGSSPSNARQPHSAKDFRTTSARRLSLGIEGQPGPLTRSLFSSL